MACWKGTTELNTNEKDLERIVAVEGPLKRNHRLGGGRLETCAFVYMSERLKPETLMVVREDPSFYQLCVSAYLERANYEASVARKNNNHHHHSQYERKNPSQ